jgi:hypothetical protein
VVPGASRQRRRETGPPTRRASPAGKGASGHLVPESGQSFIVMLLVILPVLLLVLGVTHDLGNAAAAVVIAQNAADLAAHEAAKLIDVAYFVEWEEVRLRPQAALVAQQVADDLTGGAFRVDAVFTHDTIVVVEGHVVVQTPFLRVFLGIPSIARAVQGVAEIAHGAEVAGE